MVSELKICTQCNQRLPLTMYYRASKGRGLVAECKTCWNKRGVQRYYKKREAVLAYQKGRNRRIREEVIAHYGGKCVCCSEDTYEFLAIDHVNGGGRKHRQNITIRLDQWLHQNGFPAGYQVLCHNCNMAKGAYGACPHLNKNEGRQHGV